MVTKATIDRAELFLFKQTKAVPGDVEVFAAECNTLINTVAAKSLKNALKVSERFVKRSKSTGGVLLATARRCFARTLHMSGKYEKAKEQYLHARRLYRGDLRMQSLIDRALIDVYMYTGNYPEARRRATAALNNFSKLSLADDVAKTRVNYANLLHRQDRHREAEQLYAEAASFFESINDPLATARCYYNRANTLVQLFEFEKSEKLYKESRDLYESNGHPVDANDAVYGQAWSLMLRGEFHRSLLELQKCEATYRQIGNPKGATLCLLDRAELLLNLNLFEQAYDSAERALEGFNKLGIRYEKAKAQYFRGMAATFLGKNQVARRSLEQAFEGFKIEKNHGFKGACLLMQSKLAESRGLRKSHLLGARKHFNRGQLPLWQAVCDLEIASMAGKRDGRLTLLNRNKVILTVPSLYATWQTLRGDFEAASGKTIKAINCWEKAAQRLDAVRSSLPPVEQRTSYLSALDSPHLRLVESLHVTNPSLSSVWAERFLTAGTWAPLETNSDSSDLTEIKITLYQLSAKMAAVQRYSLGTNKRSSASVSRTNKSLTQLQSKFSELIIRAEKLQKGTPDELNSLAKSFRRVSSNQPVVQFIPLKEDLLAFVHTGSGVRQHRFKKGSTKLSESLEYWRFLTERYQVSETEGSTLRLSQENLLLGSMGDWLWKPLELDCGYKNVLIIAGGISANVPWQGLIVDRQFLGDRINIFQCPSLRHYLKAVKTKTNSKKRMLFSGQLNETPMAHSEVKYLNRLTKGTSEVHLPSSRSDWPTSGSYDLWHYAGHAFMRSDNPFYSYLDLNDGPLFAVDFRTRNVLVNLVVLAACRTGEQSSVGGMEPTGLVRSLMEMGARNVIASKWQVSDRITSQWMKLFYQSYFDGGGLTASYRLATDKIRKKNPSVYYWGPFTLFGAN